MKDLRRKFEDNEADIITELYARHFKNKPDTSVTQKSVTQKSVTDRPGQVEQGGILNSSDGYEAPPTDSIEELVGFNTDIEDEAMQRRDKNFTRRPSQSAGGAPRPETYSKPLQDKIKYVQYIPKEARGTLEDVVNQLYHQKDIYRKLNEGEPGDSTMTNSSRKKNFWQNMATRVSSKHCRTRHRHAANCVKSKETDLSQL